MKTAKTAKDTLETHAPVVKVITVPLSDAVENAYLKANERFDEITLTMKDLLSIWLKNKIQARTEKYVNKIPKMLKDSLDDPDMPRLIARRKDDLIDMIWPDVREEIMWEVAVRLDREKMDNIDETDQGPDCFRRFFRYHLHPYNKSFWAKWRDPVYIGFLAFSCLPISACSPIAFLFLFLIIDHSDEYQLIYFILWFKGMQFFSHGILRTIMGFFMYFACVTMPKDADQHGCENLGPGLAGHFETIMGGWFLQVILVWTAWALLMCSKDKGRSHLKGRIGHEHTGVSKSGGYLRMFLIIDLCCFLILCGVLVGVFLVDKGGKYNRDWPVAHALFACQVVYGYVSIPFFFFTLPVFQSVLTHAIATAYDEQGRTVRWTGKPKKKKEKKPEDKNSNTTEELITTEEANKLMDKIKILFKGGKVEIEQGLSKRSAASSSSVPPSVMGGSSGITLGPEDVSLVPDDRV